MPRPTASSRKLILDLKYETQKLYAWLNTLNWLAHTPKTALAWAHMASFIQTSQAIITLAQHKQYAAAAPLVRGAGDCVVNCTLMIEQCSDENAIMAGWLEKRRFTNKILNQARRAYSLGEIETAEDFKQELNQKLAAIEKDDQEYYFDMPIDQRWKAIGQERFYHTCYTLLSSRS